MNGLQVDMPPEVGLKNRVVFTILKNDDAHGVVEFRQSRLVVHEHDRRVVVSVLRTGGLNLFCYGVLEMVVRRPDNTIHRIAIFQASYGVILIKL
jgi:uncharacterized membrane protein (DUF2068 family)